MHFNAVNFAIYVSFHRGSERKKNTQNTERHFERSSCFGPFPAFKLLPFFVTVCIFRKVFLPQTRKDRATATGWSHDLGVSVCEDWCDHPVVAEVWRFYGFSISRHLIFERRRKTSDAYVGTPLPSFSNQISPCFRCDNSIIAVGLCLFRCFRRIFENCSYTHWAMTDLDRRIFESGHIPTEL